MDALSAILQSVKLEGAVFYNAEFTAPWGFRSPPSCEVAAFLGKGPKHVIIYHLLTKGRARAEVEDGTHGVELVAGDIVVFPHGDAHIISNGSPPSIVDNGKQLKEVFSQGMVPARSGGGGESTFFVCGYLECDRELSKTFLGGLPPVFKVNIRKDPAGQWLENSIKFSAGEASSNRRAATRYWRGCPKRSLWKPCAVTWQSCRRSRRAGSQEREIRGWEQTSQCHATCHTCHQVGSANDPNSGFGLKSRLPVKWRSA